MLQAGVPWTALQMSCCGEPEAREVVPAAVTEAKADRGLQPGRCSSHSAHSPLHVRLTAPPIQWPGSWGKQFGLQTGNERADYEQMGANWKEMTGGVTAHGAVPT